MLCGYKKKKDDALLKIFLSYSMS